MKHSPVLKRLHLDLSADLDRIRERFKNPKITLIVRTPDVIGEGDVVLTDDDLEEAIASIRRLQVSPTAVTVNQQGDQVRS